jgi:hypothetical protein
MTTVFRRTYADVVGILILTRKLLVDPEELLAFVHYADETAKARSLALNKVTKRTGINFSSPFCLKFLLQQTHPIKPDLAAGF